MTKNHAVFYVKENREKKTLKFLIIIVYLFLKKILLLLE